MRSIAIEEDRWLFYEGARGYGHAIWPPPSITVATILRAGADVESALPNTGYINEQKMVFREDSFDPVTRIRRGRLYKACRDTFELSARVSWVDFLYSKSANRTGEQYV